MKYPLVFILLFVVTTAFADERFAGTWAWSGSQCRDNDMSTNSARSVADDVAGVPSISSAVITVDGSSDKASFRLALENGEETREQGTYQVSGNKIDMGNDTGGLTAYLIDSLLVVYNEEDSHIGCRESEKFVYIFGRVN